MKTLKANPTNPKALRNQRLPEILAPAGGRKQFLAALNAGADAVYLGLKEFNARGRAENFSIDDLEELVPLANRQGMKVLVTLNILLKDCELPSLIERLSKLMWVGIHAVIVQDVGVARIVREYFPTLRLHASTQMAVHNAHGIREAMELGFRRVVLARELTFQELQLIRKELPQEEVEIEVFCHGSLCYSYSGLCFFSGAEDARSGNRGECAYTCRKPYKILNEPGHGFLFSMKDLDTSAHIEKFVKAGIDTLKIEGRKKDAQYVGTVVGLYRKMLSDFAGYDTNPRGLNRNRDFVKDMSFSFHRATSGFFTNGRYQENVIDLDNPTHKGLLVGQISAVNGRTIQFRSKEPLEKFDGLRIDGEEKVYHAKPQHGGALRGSIHAASRKYENEVTQFSIRNLRIAGKSVNTSKANQKVEISLPEEVTIPKAGDLIYKVRSNELKRTTEQLIQVPKGERLQQRKKINLQASCQLLDGEIEIKFSTSFQGINLATCSFMFVADRPKTTSSLQDDVQQQFKTFGDQRIDCEVSFHEGDWEWFVSRKLLKEAKNSLSQRLADAIASFQTNIIQQTEIALGHELTTLKPSNQGSYSIKFDRLEYLAGLQSVLDSSLKSVINELIFEPKRSFLGNQSPVELFEKLFQFVQDHGISLRFSIPLIIRAWDETLLKRWLKAFVSLGGERFEVGNVGGLSLLKQTGIDPNRFDVHSDFSLYSLNTSAVQELTERGIDRVTLSVEDDFSSIEEKLHRWPKTAASPQIILYKDTPLFIAEACSLTALHQGCPGSKVCGYRSLEIENDQGERFHVAHEACKSIVYGDQAFSWSQHRVQLQEAGVSHFRIDFLTRDYSTEEFVDIVASCIDGVSIANTQQANFQRQLL